MGIVPLLGYNVANKQQGEHNMTNAEILGEKLYQLRKSKGISQEELADQLNVSRQAISKWERGEALPDTDNLISISKLYNVSLDALVGNPSLADDTDATTQQPITDVATAEIQTDIIAAEASDITTSAPQQVNGIHNGKNRKFTRLLEELPYPIVITVAYLLWGFFGQRGWSVGWTFYITIPVYYSIIECIKKKKVSEFCYPVLCVFVYCFCGMMWNLWHPLWVVFVTVPAFYSIAHVIDRK